MSRFQRITRRTMLRGTGALLALPWLESMTRSVRGSEPAGPPVRLGFFYVPNGVQMADWKPAASGELSELSPILQPLASQLSRVTVISGLAADHCNGNGAAHEPAGGGFLVGARCRHSEEPEVGGISVDQHAAREAGFMTPVDSLALGVDPGHRGDHGYSGTYMSHISWSNPASPVPLELNPKRLYERLFRGAAPRQPDWTRTATQATSSRVDSIETSVLDLVSEDARALQRELGYSDRRTLAEYLEGVRSIERRIAAASRDSHSHHQGAFVDDPSLVDDDPTLPELIVPEGKGIPSVYAEHVELMLDLMTLAYRTDTTRFASFMFSYEKSGRAYPEIEAPGAHHSTSHHDKKPENLSQLTRINTHHMSLFAKMLERMSQIDEGGSSLLDNVLFLYGSGISDGAVHNHDDLPILVAGGAGCGLAGGRHLVLEKTPICNLYVEMLNRAGVGTERFGDSTGRLALS